MKKIEDIRPYLKYYAGKKVKFHDGRIFEFGGVTSDSTVRCNNTTWPIHLFEHGVAKLILRPLSSMTEDEEEQYMRAVDEWNFGFKQNMLGAAAATHYLLSRGFDLFNLIESGLAVDASTIKNT